MQVYVANDFSYIVLKLICQAVKLKYTKPIIEEEYNEIFKQIINRSNCISS